MVNDLKPRWLKKVLAFIPDAFEERPFEALAAIRMTIVILIASAVGSLVVLALVFEPREVLALVKEIWGLKGSGP